MQKSSWHYWQQWRQRFPLQRDVHFDQGILSNEYCRDCRYCCGPQDCATPFPMKLLPSQQHAHLDRDFFLLAPDTACLDDRGCKSCGPEGCLLPRQRRPVACSLFPLVLLETGLYLYKICPAVLFLPLDRWLIMAREAVGDDDRILVEPFTGLTVEYAAKRGACAILRGLRAVSDFEYEFQLALMNRRLQRDIQTVFLMTDYQWLFISSTIVKAAASHGADIVGLVPENVRLRLMEKYQRGEVRQATPCLSAPYGGFRVNK